MAELRDSIELIRGEGSLELLTLDSLLQVLDLVPDELLHDLAKAIQIELSSLYRTELVVDALILCLEIGVWLAFDLVSFEELSKEDLHFVSLQHVSVVFVQGHEDVLVHFVELGRVNQDVSKVLDGLRVVHSKLLLVPLLVEIRVRL